MQILDRNPPENPSDERSSGHLLVDIAQHLLVACRLLSHFRMLPAHLHPLFRFKLGKLFLNLPLLGFQLLQVALHLFQQHLPKRFQKGFQRILTKDYEGFFYVAQVAALAVELLQRLLQLAVLLDVLEQRQPQ